MSENPSWEQILHQFSHLKPQQQEAIRQIVRLKSEEMARLNNPQLYAHDQDVRQLAPQETADLTIKMLTHLQRSLLDSTMPADQRQIVINIMNEHLYRMPWRKKLFGQIGMNVPVLLLINIFGFLSLAEAVSLIIWLIIHSLLHLI